MSRMDTFSNYTRQGGMWQMGFEPEFFGPDGKTTSFHGYNSHWSLTKGDLMPVPGAAGSATGLAKWGSVLGSGAGAVFSGINIVHGYNENGLSGAKDAMVWDLAMSGAATRFAYGAIGSSGAAYGPGSWFGTKSLKYTGIKKAGQAIVFGGGAGAWGGIAATAGAGLGATLGQSVLGTPGAFIGAYIGAAPLRFAATHPLLAAGATAGAAAAAVGYGTYSMVKGGLQAGYNHRQGQRGINTSGSMAAFMTTGSQTMRSRAVQAIQRSHMNARSALGQEAGFMHMPGKNYHSSYR